MIILVALATPSVAQSKIAILPDPACSAGGLLFETLVRGFLDTIEKTGDCTHVRPPPGPTLNCDRPDASFREIVQCLDSSTDVTVVIRCQLKGQPMTFAFDSLDGATDARNGMNLRAFARAFRGEPTDALIDFNPALQARFKGENCYSEPSATLVHEMTHAWLLVHGWVKNVHWKPGIGSGSSPPDEGGKDGTLAHENAYRLSTQLPCQRGSYEGVPVTSIAQMCLGVCCKCERGNFNPIMCAVDPNDYCYVYLDSLASPCGCPNTPPRCDPAVQLLGPLCDFPACG